MEPAKDVCHQTCILDPPTAAGPLHYAAAMALVAALAGGFAYEAGRAAPTDTASQTEEAVMVELPPVEAGAHPRGDDAPPQEAAQASAGAQAPPQPTPEPPDETAPKPSSPAEERVPQMPAPAAVLQQVAKPPPQVQAPATAPQAAREAGVPTQARASAEDADDTETRLASAHLITLWQKALMGRLQAARHGVAIHATGVAKIAFAIDREGHLVSARIAHGSGSPVVDAAALALVRRAAPFPTPPTGAGGKELTFVVPISFRRGSR